MTNRTNYWRRPYWARIDAEAGGGETGARAKTPARSEALRISDPVKKGELAAPPGSGEAMPREGYLTTVEAAKVLRLSSRTLERYRVEGGGPRFRKAGGGKRARVLYREDDLIAWLEARVFSSTSEY